jgi:hypothetical protein
MANHAAWLERLELAEAPVLTSGTRSGDDDDAPAFGAAPKA